MGFCADLKTRLAVYPRGLDESGMLTDNNSLHWVSKYGFIVTEETSIHNAAADGMNERGLGAHLLYMDGTALPARSVAVPGVSSMIFVRYLLENYATVNEVVTQITNYQIVQYPVKIQGVDFYFPFHVTVEDASGDAAIIEFVKGKLSVYHGSQYNVMTNEPPYDLQLRHLAQVKQQHRYLNTILPGGADSKNRFVRAAYYSETIPTPANPQDAVDYMFAAIQGTIVPYYKNYQECGFDGHRAHDNNIDDVWPSIYQTVLDHSHQIYYYSDSLVGNRISVDLNQIDLSIGQSTKFLNPRDAALVGNVTAKFSDSK